ncbi:MAG: phenylalanyl-tRNA synthetase alpha chain [Acidimicrobiia bacterium]|nr:phenylalanyl-tRNA synthetase alpha chain [Acidimicrobiia bacterium]
MEEHLERVSRVRREALDKLAAAADLEAFRAAEVDVLGRRSPLVELRKALGALDAEARRTVGQALNEARAAVEEAAATRKASFAEEDRRRVLESERLDLTEVVPGRRLGHAHLVSQAWERLEDVFVGMGFTVSEGPEVETEWYNFGALNFPEGHPARESFDSLWVDWGEPGSTLLRTHTSPVQIRAMLQARPPIYTVCPGRVFRQDTPDATHMPVFHQIEGLVVDRNITLGDLAGTLDAFTKAYFGEEFSARLRPSYFPFTEPSAEFDILRPDGTWLELGGCGMVHPNVLRNGGIDPEEWSGFAFGFGIDRMALMRHGVDDLREFFAGDLRFLTQF